jgi:hypothetical protein
LKEEDEESFKFFRRFFFVFLFFYGFLDDDVGLIYLNRLMENWLLGSPPPIILSVIWWDEKPIKLPQFHHKLLIP